MSTHPQSHRKGLRSKGPGLAPSVNHHSALSANSQNVLHRLRDVLQRTLSAVKTLWSFQTHDWVTDVYAADIDNDGDVEILIGSRDGFVYARTRRGQPKWERRLPDGQYVSAVFVVPQTETAQATRARVIVGTRSGKVYALDKNGEILGDWEYDAGRMIRQIYISPRSPESVVIGSEDRCIHVLDSATGCPRAKFPTNGWVRCVFCCDIDGDGNDEILGGSGDKYLYILDRQGRYLDRLLIGHQVYALSAASLEAGGPINIITSSNRKDLAAWTISRRSNGRWRPSKQWEKTPKDNLFENRVHSIVLADIDHDDTPEILVGSEDGHLYVLDHQGTPLWKHNFHSCVYSVYAADINFDGEIEVLVGTENKEAYALHLDLIGNYFQAIKDAYRQARSTGNDDIIKELSLTEKAVLEDFTKELSPSRHPQMEMQVALSLMEAQAYEQALSIFLRLLEEKVQYYWAQPVRARGYIWTERFSNISDGPTNEIIVGTDQGYIHAFDIEREKNKQLWVKSLGDRVRMLQTGLTNAEGYDSIVAVLANHRLVILDHTGEISKEHTFGDKRDWARSVSIHTGSAGQGALTSEIIIGLENNKVSIWDAALQHQLATINTPQGISVVYISDITGDGTGEIISGSIHNQVYVHNRQGEELWRFETKGHVNALYVEDIDKDGHVEIIVGSEDRNVYVLDHEGHLKWRYETMRGVFDVDVCDIKLEHDPEDAQQRPWKVLVSSSDNYLYMFNASGDLVWKYRSNNRIRTARAADLNRDGKYEIAVASEDQLELLQILNRDELLSYIQACWGKLLEREREKDSIMNLSHDQDEYIRGYALAKLAGWHLRHNEDFKRLQDAVKNDSSLQVRKELVRSIVLLYLNPFHYEENMRCARQLLAALSDDPEEEIRLAIIDILPMFLSRPDKKEEGLCFEYLEGFAHNVDVEVRRAVVRQLNKLVGDYPERVFGLLLRIAYDESEWIRQECGRVFARYFDTHTQLLVRDMVTLLYNGTETAVFKQISYSANVPAVKRVFRALVKLLTELSAGNIAEILDEAIAAIEEINRSGTLYGEELLQIYEEFRQLLRVKTISAMAHYQRITRPDMLDYVLPASMRSTSMIMPVFEALQQVVLIAKTYERRESMGDRATSLMAAIDTLEKIRNDLREGEMHQRQSKALLHTYRLPENIILSVLLDQWSRVIKGELSRLRGAAHLVGEIRNKVVQREEQVVISLLIRNDGHTPADNVRVVLEESNDFDIVGSNERPVLEIPTSTPTTVDFTIRPRVATPRLSFLFIYDDAERRARKKAFADIVTIEEHQRPYRLIPNPYTSGTPIRDRGMFYGRQEDLESLRDKLSSISANQVVLLSGQRRMGKTSLIYQLADELSHDPYAPVLVDLQSLALVSSTEQFLLNFAERIQEEVLHYKGIEVAAPDPQAFQARGTRAFDDYLAQVLQALPECKLVFLLDEFEKLQEHFQQGILNERMLEYLRHLMQHRQRLNFLLAGTRRMLHFVEEKWSVFFNIASAHPLSRLKPQEAIDLITKPISKYLEYDPLALERVRKLTDDQPYLIHMMSERLIAHCNKQRKSYVTINDVNIVLDLILEEQETSFRWIWDQSSPTEHFILSILAQEKGEEGRVFSFNDILSEYEAQGVSYVRKEVSDALQNLVKEDIIEERLDGTQFRIPVGLLKEWLRKDKPPERVAREELLGEE